MYLLLTVFYFRDDSLVTRMALVVSGSLFLKVDGLQLNHLIELSLRDSSLVGKPQRSRSFLRGLGL